MQIYFFIYVGDTLAQQPPQQSENASDFACLPFSTSGSHLALNTKYNPNSLVFQVFDHKLM